MDIKIKPLDESKLFTTTIYSDGENGQLQVREPHNFDGYQVLSRETVYLGVTQIQTAAGPITVQFQIEAKTPREAFEKWSSGAAEACRKVLEDIQSKALRASILAPGKKGQ